MKKNKSIHHIAVKDKKSVDRDGELTIDIIEKLKIMHNRNQQKELQAQETNKGYVSKFVNTREKFYQQIPSLMEERENRINKQKQKIIDMIRKKNEQAKKILQRVKLRETEDLNKRYQDSKKKYDIKHSDKTSPAVTPQKNIGQRLSCVHNPTQLINYTKSLATSQELSQKSLQKQQKAEENRMNHQKFLKTLYRQSNMQKKLVKSQAQQLEQQKNRILMQQSINKLQNFEYRYSDSKQALQKIRKSKNQQKNKRARNAREKLYASSENYQNKFINLDTTYRNKQNSFVMNKQNIIKNQVLDKKSKRQNKQRNNQQQFLKVKQSYLTKVQEIYKKDREQWHFLTCVNQIKEQLIENNIYENNQIALKK